MDRSISELTNLLRGLIVTSDENSGNVNTNTDSNGDVYIKQENDVPIKKRKTDETKATVPNLKRLISTDSERFAKALPLASILNKTSSLSGESLSRLSSIDNMMDTSNTNNMFDFDNEEGWDEEADSDVINVLLEPELEDIAEENDDGSTTYRFS